MKTKKILCLLLAMVIIFTNLSITNVLASVSNNVVKEYMNKGYFGENKNPEAEATIREFISLAVFSNSYNHGEDAVEVAIAKNWITAAEFSDLDAKISRGQMAKIALGIADIEIPTGIGLDKYCELAKEKGIMQYKDGELNPEKNSTLAESIAVLENVREKINEKNTGIPAPVVSIEDFFKSPESAGFQMSDSGEYLAYAAAYENRLNVFVKKMNEDSEPVRVSNTTDRGIAGFNWKNDKILYYKDNGGDENYHTYVVNIDGTGEKDLTPYEGVVATPMDILEDVENEILIQMNKLNPQVFDIYKLNIMTGETKLITQNPGNVSGMLTDRQGNVRLAAISDGVESTLLIRETEEDEFVPFYETKDSDIFSPFSFSEDGKMLYIISNVGRNTTAVIQYNIATREETVLYSDAKYDISNAEMKKDGSGLSLVTINADKVRYVFFDDELKVIYDKVQEKFNAKQFALNLNKEKNKAIVTIYSDKNAGEYFYYNLKTDTVVDLGKVYPWIHSDDMCEMIPVSYKARDGLTIHGYLTLPKNIKPENLSVVINPHGGPWLRDSWGYNPEVQLLANRGYAVLQMNFRGSLGYGKEFLKASYKQWGLAMQDDITDGVNWLIKNGIANKDKIAIYGASYGGYATLTGITKTPDLYVAAVDYCGISSVFTFLENFPPYWLPLMNQMYERIGNPETETELLKAASPINYLDKIKTPLLVAQGTNDVRVTQAESDAVVNALRERGVEVTYILKENEGHGFQLQENQFEFYNAMIDFLAKYLK